VREQPLSRNLRVRPCLISFRLRDGEVTIARASLSLTYPARFMLVAAMNPCPCGLLGDSRRQCTCSAPGAQRYLARVSGPLLDRIDLHVEVPVPSYRELADVQPAEPSEAVLKTAVARLGLSARAYHRILVIARTIADLEGAADLNTAHVAEAIQYRSLDRLLRG
jgi:magnesium chelatase family protein